MHGLVYTPIDRRIRTFRLLKIIGLDEYDRPVCRMRNALLGEVSYYALSYTWGPPEDQRVVVVNGQTISVRSNLEAFLRKGYAQFSGIWIWIDALCINQDDLQERNHQVRQMGSVYAQANKVIVWLGTDQQGLSGLFWLLNQDNDTLAKYNTDLMRSIVRDIVQLDKNSYWRRMWVVPELLLARDIRMLYGDEVISWNDFWHGIDFLKLRRIHHHLFTEHLIDDLNMHGHRAHRSRRDQNPEQLFLTDLFRTYATFECAEALDRLFALLPLFANGGFSVDYSESPERLALRLWLHLRCKNISCPPLYDLMKALTPDHIFDKHFRTFGVTTGDILKPYLRKLFDTHNIKLGGGDTSLFGNSPAAADEPSDLRGCIVSADIKGHKATHGCRKKCPGLPSIGLSRFLAVRQRRFQQYKVRTPRALLSYKKVPSRMEPGWLHKAMFSYVGDFTADEWSFVRIGPSQYHITNNNFCVKRVGRMGLCSACDHLRRSDVGMDIVFDFQTRRPSNFRKLLAAISPAFICRILMDLFLRFWTFFADGLFLMKTGTPEIYQLLDEWLSEKHGSSQHV